MNNSDTTPGPVAATDGGNTPKSASAIATLLVAAFVVILNETLMAVATPKIMADLHVTAGVAQWVSTGFMLTMGVVIPITGFLIQRYRTRILFLAAMSLFCLGTIIAGAAPAFPFLVAGRIVQASGTAIMMPLLMTTILALVPMEKRGAAMGNVMVVIAVAPALGPTVSGFIVQSLSWRFLFFLILPIALGATAYGWKTLVNISEPREARLDVPSVLLSIPAFGATVYAFSQAGESAMGWSDPLVLAPLAVGIIALIVFAVRQFRLTDPILDLRAFGYRTFALSTIIIGTTMALLFAVSILLPLFLQKVHGLTPVTTGLVLLPGGVLLGFAGPTVGRLFDRYGPRLLSITGAAILVLSLWRFSVISPATPVWQIVAMQMTLTLGIAMMMTPIQTTGLNQLPRHLHSHGTAIIGTIQQVAGAIGTALLVTIMTSLSRVAPTDTDVVKRAALTHGFQFAFLLSALLCLVPLVLVFFIKRTEGETGVATPTH